MASDKSILVLSDRRWLASRMSPAMFVAVLLAVTVLPFILIVTLIFPDAPWEQLLSKVPEYLGKIDWSHIHWANAIANLAMLGIVLGQIVYLSRAQKLERLTLSPDGIRYTSPLPSSLKQFKPDWFLPWSQVSKAELGTPNGKLLNAAFVQLTFYTSSEKQRIFTALWVDPETYSRPATRFKLAATSTVQPPDEILKSVMDSEVLRYISRNVPHLSIESTLNKAEVFTSLEKNPHGRIAVGIVFLLMAYTFLDAILGPESYVDQPSSLLYIYIAAGIIGAILSGAWLYKSTLAIGEKAGLSMLIGVLVGVAMLPGALRINAMTDPHGSRTSDYFVTQNADGVILHPVADGLPSIDYFARNKFWEKFDKHETYPIQIHKGVFGFYQFNSSVIVEDIQRHEND